MPGLRVNVVPQKLKDGENAALTTPLTVTGTDEELDRELPTTIVNFVSAHLLLRNTQDRAKAEMDAAAKTAQAEACSKTKAPVKREPPMLDTGAVETPKPSQAVKTEIPKTGSLFDASACAPSAASVDTEKEEEIFGAVEYAEPMDEDVELDEAT
jgi:PRTRC genetic system protein E